MKRSRFAVPVVAALLMVGVSPAAGAGPSEPTANPTATPTAAGSVFTPVSPVRVLDTRTGAPVGPGRTITVDLSSRLPASATAVVLNLTGVGPTAPTFVTVFPDGSARPTASNLNLAAGETRPNLVTVAVPAGRRLAVYNNAGSVHLIADLAGYYSTGGGARYTGIQAARLFDTRESAPLGPGASMTLDLTDRVPASATAVTFSLTGSQASAPTFVTAWPAGATRPTASNLNLGAGETRSNLVTVAVGANRRVTLYNNAGSVHLMADLAGFYTPEYGATFTPMPPSRVLDTRDGTGTGGSTNPVGPFSTITLDLGRLPVTAGAVVFNLTGIDATAATHVTAAWGLGNGRPTTSNLNLAAGQTASVLAAVAFNHDRTVGLFNNAGYVHLAADLAGVFTFPPASCTADCVVTWGHNASRQLGTTLAVHQSPVPTPVVGLSGVRAITGGYHLNGYALHHDGTVSAWGINNGGQLGGGWAGGASYVPVRVVGLSDVVAIANASTTAYALRRDGTVWAWGYGALGQLGNGQDRHSSVPVRVSGLTGIVAIAGGDDTGYALRNDGTVWAWGLNSRGQLGDGSSVTFSTTPVRVAGLDGVTAIAGGGGGYALRNDGTVWAWGPNDYGQLGNGVRCSAPGTDECETNVPVQVTGLTGVVAIAGDRAHGYAIRADATAWNWGSSTAGSLGDGTDCQPRPDLPCISPVPVRVAGLTGVTALDGHGLGGYALLSDGTVWAWGFNTEDQLGNPAAGPRSTVPVRVSDLTGVSTITGLIMAGAALVPGPA